MAGRTADAPDSGTPRPRERVIIGAYHCVPGQGPEGEAGWAFARAAAQHYDLWIITRRYFEAEVRAALADDPEFAGRATFVFHDPPDRVVRAKRRGLDLYWFYPLWQRGAGTIARRLHQELGFSLAHHLTFANDWLPCALVRLRDVPLIWGPVGGATLAPVELARYLGVRGALGELLRSLASGLFRYTSGDRAARHAAVILAQNADVARRFAYGRRVVLEPNAAFRMAEFRSGPASASSAAASASPAASASSAGSASPDPAPPRAVFAGRLIPWKGARLAVEAIADPRLSGWLLDIYGTGPERARLLQRAAELGVSDRVVLHGHCPRVEVLEAYRSATVMLFPSMHDGASWAVGEASSLGLPVVCLDRGGPPILAERNGFPVTADGPVIDKLVTAVLQAAARGGVPHDRWSEERLPELVADWYADAIADRGRAPIGVLAPLRQLTRRWQARLVRGRNDALRSDEQRGPNSA